MTYSLDFKANVYLHASSPDVTSEVNFTKGLSLNDVDCIVLVLIN